MATLDIIIPTWNNPQYLRPCVQSIIRTGILNGLAHLYIVNNGTDDIKAFVKEQQGITVLSPGQNLGWERGLEYGLKHSTAPFVCFQNDDTQIPRANIDLYQRLMIPFQDQHVAAVGPITTVASGWHSIYMNDPIDVNTEVPFLIFFTVMLRRSDLDAAGGIDTSCPGGDDFDLSIRLRKMGKKLLVTPEAFLIHHGFKSGTRLRGDHTVNGGWNSVQMRDETNQWLIQKHGFKTYYATVSSGVIPYVAGTELKEASVA